MAHFHFVCQLNNSFRFITRNNTFQVARWKLIYLIKTYPRVQGIGNSFRINPYQLLVFPIFFIDKESRGERYHVFRWKTEETSVKDVLLHDQPRTTGRRATRRSVKGYNWIVYCHKVSIEGKLVYCQREGDCPLLGSEVNVAHTTTISGSSTTRDWKLGRVLPICREFD